MRRPRRSAGDHQVGRGLRGDEQLLREPYPAPALWLDPDLRGVDDAVARYREIVARAKRGEAPGPLLDGFAKLQNYQYHPPIKAKMAV